MKEKVDQHKLAESLTKSISYEFIDSFLVKPLDPVKVQKEFSKPVSTDVPTKDKNGVEAVDYDKVETEVKEVDSDYRKGVVLKIPTSFLNMKKDESHNYAQIDIKVGDVVVFLERSARFFDLLKDSRLVRYYDIVAIER